MRFKNPFRNFVFPLSNPFAISYFLSQGTLASPRTKSSASLLKNEFQELKNENFKTVWQNLISSRKNLARNNKIVFQMRGGAVVFDRIFCKLLPLRIFCDQKLLKGNLLQFFSKKLSGETLCKFLKFSRQKS